MYLVFTLIKERQQGNSQRFPIYNNAIIHHHHFRYRISKVFTNDQPVRQCFNVILIVSFNSEDIHATVILSKPYGNKTVIASHQRRRVTAGVINIRSVRNVGVTLSLLVIQCSIQGHGLGHPRLVIQTIRLNDRDYRDVNFASYKTDGLHNSVFHRPSHIIVTQPGSQRAITFHGSKRIFNYLLHGTSNIRHVNHHD